MKLGPQTNLQVKVVLLIGSALLVAGVFTAYAVSRSSWATREGRPPPQPVAFSHAHHVGGLGIDCRFCHHHAEEAPMAGLPPTEVCMGCHSELYTRADMLAPIRLSWETGEPVPWTRVYDLPDHAYFDHSVHVQAGVPCEHCHGRVDRQPLTARARDMFMEFCLDCHRDPAPHLRPREAVYAMGWEGPAVEHPPVEIAGLTNCTTCHR